MNESITAEELSAEKAQQQANREARPRQLHSPDELWARQQKAVAELKCLRHDAGTRRPDSKEK
jgi:hypothetical protein